MSGKTTEDGQTNAAAAQESVSDLAECDMTASMLAATRQKITTEEEAKAALAERRRLAREQAERDAELERQRLVCVYIYIKIKKLKLINF